MIGEQDVIDWLTGAGLSTATKIGPEVAGEADQLVVVTMTGGPGLALEGLFDNATCQVRCRGKQNDPVSAKALAEQVDDLFVDASLPTTIGGRYVKQVGRVGGPPAFYQRDSSRRTHYTCNYVISAARN